MSASDEHSESIILRGGGSLRGSLFTADVTLVKLAEKLYGLRVTSITTECLCVSESQMPYGELRGYFTQCKFLNDLCHRTGEIELLCDEKNDDGAYVRVPSVKGLCTLEKGACLSFEFNEHISPKTARATIKNFTHLFMVVS